MFTGRINGWSADFVLIMDVSVLYVFVHSCLRFFLFYITIYSSYTAKYYNRFRIYCQISYTYVHYYHNMLCVAEILEYLIFL